MRDDDFKNLVSSIREGGRILRGEVKAARRRTASDLPPESQAVLEARVRAQLSQVDFATRLGVSVGTYRGWEQGRRKPTGPARVLIEVSRQYPDAVRAAAMTLRKSASTLHERGTTRYTVERSVHTADSRTLGGKIRKKAAKRARSKE
ncbi:MAG TPA: helix-turn-helix domain-containing protein [Gemmatimonadales bacterium]|jgi:putative transcriptional regulator